MKEPIATEYGTFFDQHRPPWGCTHSTRPHITCAHCQREWMEWERGTRMLRQLDDLHTLIHSLNENLRKAGMYGTLRPGNVEEWG